MMKRTIFLILTLFLFSFPLAAQNVDRQREQKKKIEDEIAYIDRQLDANRSKKKKSLGTLVLTRKKIESRKSLIRELDGDISRIDRQIVSKNREIALLNERLDTLKKYHQDLILNSYKTRDTRVWFMYILASENLSQGMRRWSYLKNITQAIHQQANEIKSTELNLKLEKSKLEGLRAESVRNRKRREKEYDVLNNEQKNVNHILSQLSRQERDMKKELSRKKKEVEKLNREIEKILTRTVKAQTSGAEKEKIDYRLSAKFGENRGRLPWPVEKGIIIQKFGQTFHPVFKNLKLPFNNGINISSESGSKARCIFDGTIKQILVMPGYNQCVLVQHGEYFTFYCKLKMVTVKAGDEISTGDEIGIIDNNEDGNAEIHFQLWKGTSKQNPELWLRKR